MTGSRRPRSIAGSGPLRPDGRQAEGPRAGEPRASAGQRDPAQGKCLFSDGGARPPIQAIIAFIDDHRGAHGSSRFARFLPIAPSTYRAHVAKRRDPAKLSARARQDATLRIEVRRVFDENFETSGDVECRHSVLPSRLATLKMLWEQPIITSGTEPQPPRV